MHHSCCKDCGTFFTRKNQTGIECKTCSSLFHKECFANSEDVDDYCKTEEDFDNSEDLLTESINDFHLGEMD